MANNALPPIPHERWWTRAIAFGKYWLALVSAAIAIYVAGSIIFGDWWYGYFWDNGFKQAQYYIDALSFLVSHYFRLTIAIMVMGFLFVGLGILLKKRILPAIHRFAWLIALYGCTAILVDALVLRYTLEQTYQPYHFSLERFSKAFNDLYQQLGAVPRIEPPIYFHYLNKEPIDGLYNQIQSELEEKEREVSGDTTVKGKAEAHGIGVEAGAESHAKSTLSRTDFTPERKALGVMQYVQTISPERYYTDESEWRVRKTIALQREMFGPDPLKMRPGDNEVLNRAIESNRPLWNSQLKSELAVLTGLVFVDGDFDRSSPLFTHSLL
jgi:hypothetical protein